MKRIVLILLSLVLVFSTMSLITFAEDASYSIPEMFYQDQVGQDHYTQESLEAFHNAIQQGQTMEEAATLLVATQNSNSIKFKLDKNTDSYNSGTYYGNNFIYIQFDNVNPQFMQLTTNETLSFNQELVLFRNEKGSTTLASFMGMTFSDDQNCGEHNHRGILKITDKANVESALLCLNGKTADNSQLTTWEWESDFDKTEITNDYPVRGGYNLGDTNIVENGQLKSESIIGKNFAGTYGIYPAKSTVTLTNPNATDKQYYYRLAYRYRDTVLTSWTPSDIHIQTYIQVTNCIELVENYYNAIIVYEENKDSNLYTQTSLNKLKDIIEESADAAQGVTWLPQEEVDALADELADCAALNLKADYSDYYTALTEAQNTTFDNTLYDADSYNSFLNIISEIDNGLDKDLADTPENYQTIANAIEALQNAIANIDYVKLVPKAGFTLDKTNGTRIDKQTVEDLKAKFENDATLLIVKDYKEILLANTDYVGTGSTMYLIRRSNGEILDQAEFFVLGDVTGDGLIDNADYLVSLSIGLGDRVYYHEEQLKENLFFKANDLWDDGVIDVLDTRLIKREALS